MIAFSIGFLTCAILVWVAHFRPISLWWKGYVVYWSGPVGSDIGIWVPGSPHGWIPKIGQRVLDNTHHETGHVEYIVQSMEWREHTHDNYVTVYLMKAEHWTGNGRRILENM